MFVKPEAVIKLEAPTYGIKSEPLYQGYEERLMLSTDELINDPKSTCQICDHPIDNFSNNLCKVCEKKFEIDQEMNIQKKKKRTIANYQCEECLKAFSNVNTYQRHIKCHDEKKPYRCSQCQKRFYHSKNLAEHMEIHEAAYSFSSAVTATEASSFNVLHELTDETCVTMKTEKDDSKYPDVQLMSLRSLNDSDTIFQRSDDLTMVQIENFELFNQERDIETVDNMGSDIFYEGSISPTLSTATGSFIKIEAEKIQSQTDYEAFNVDRAADFEIKEEASETTVQQQVDRSEEVTRESYICKHCNKDFMYFGNYAKHLDQHSVGKLMCKFCHQMFGSTYQIRKHIRDFHSNQEIFECSVCFTTLPKHYFASHMRTHRSDDKTLICKYCGYRFSEPSELFYHFKNRHSDTAESNAAGGKGCAERQPIQPIEDVMGMEKYKCKYCGLIFDDVIKMYHHVKVHVKRTAEAAKKSADCKWKQ